MAIDPVTPLPSAPSRSSSPETFSADADAFMNALPAMVTEFNAATAAIPATVMGIDFTGTSVTSVAIGTGSKSFTASTGKNWYIGQAVRVAYTTTPGNYMDGQVTSYNSTTGALVVNVSAVGGSGTYAAWTIGPAIGASAYATLIGTETLTNKTLTTPVLSATAAGTTAGQIGYSGGDLSFGNGSASLVVVTTAATQTLTNKSLTTPVLTGTASGTTAGRIGYASGVLSFGDGSSQRTVVTTDGTQTLTNKTIASFILGSGALSTGGSLGYSGGLLQIGNGSTVQTVVTTDDTQSLSNKSFNSAPVPTVSGAAPIYFCRAWVQFGVSGGVVTVNASGNVSSVTRSSAGIFVINFTTAMPDANYAVHTTADSGSDGSCYARIRQGVSPTTTSVTVENYRPTVGNSDPYLMTVTVIR